MLVLRVLFSAGLAPAGPAPFSKGAFLMFTRAVKTDAKLRLALAGPPGSGKTFTALSLAHALADGQGVAVIDTEHGSASKYADLFPPFDCVNLETFHPDLYIEAIKAAEQAGYEIGRAH